MKDTVLDTTASVIGWDGEGLPPVGATIEFTHSNFIKSYHETPRKPAWFMATVKYVSPSNFVYIDDEGIERAITDIEMIRYRPLMTREERAAKHKEKAVRDIVARIDECRFGTMEEYAAQLYGFIAAGAISGLKVITDDE